MKNNYGSGLVWSLVALMFITIVISSLYLMTNQNTKEVNISKSNLQAKYIAEAGIEIAYAALLGQHPTNASKKYIDAFTLTKAAVTHIQNITDNGQRIGQVTITMSPVLRDSDVWVKVVARGVDDGTSFAHTSTLYIQVNNPANLIRE